MNKNHDACVRKTNLWR